MTQQYVEPEGEQAELELPKGDVTDGVVRIGDTVRRPHQDTSDAVAAYLRHLEAVGFDRAPRYLGRDARGRDVLDFLDGDVPGDHDIASWATSDDVLPGVARLLRALHDASEGFRPDAPMRPVRPGRPAPALPDDEPRLVAQRDLTPGNTVFRDGHAWGVIDFDLSDWTTRSLDLAGTAMHWVPLCDPVDRRPAYDGIDVGARLCAMVDSYGRDRVTARMLLAACDLRFTGTLATMRWNAENLGGGWARMWSEGIGDMIARRIEWFAAARTDLADSLADPLDRPRAHMRES